PHRAAVDGRRGVGNPVIGAVRPPVLPLDVKIPLIEIRTTELVVARSTTGGIGRVIHDDDESAVRRLAFELFPCPHWLPTSRNDSLTHGFKSSRRADGAYLIRQAEAQPAR